MFTQIAPQRVQHSLGYIVQIGSRYSIQYLDHDVIAEMEAELGKPTYIYAYTLTVRSRDGTQIETDDTQRTLLITRIKAGLDALNVNYVIVNAQS